MEKVKLGDIVSYAKGQQINGDELVENGQYDYLNGGINPSGCWTDFNVPGNTVTISEGGNSCGYVNYMPHPFWCGAHCYYLYDSKLNNKYLYYALKSQQEKIMKLRSGACMPNIKKSDLGSFEFFVSRDISIQKNVVFTLDKVTDLIDKRKEQLSKLDELVKARFVELFGDPVENPYGWEQTTLKNIAIGKLSYGSGASACEYDGNIRYVRITDIDSSGRLNNDVVSPSIIEEKYILNDGDILFARSGATVGKSYRYRESDGKCLYAGYLIRLVPNTELVLPDYVFYYTKTSYYERFIESNMKVVAQPNINAQQYGDLTICIPPMELQKDFLSFVEQTDKSKLEVQKSLEKLELLKKALMQKYFG